MLAVDSAPLAVGRDDLECADVVRGQAVAARDQADAAAEGEANYPDIGGRAMEGGQSVFPCSGYQVAPEDACVAACDTRGRVDREAAHALGLE